MQVFDELANTHGWANTYNPNMNILESGTVFEKLAFLSENTFTLFDGVFTLYFDQAVKVLQEYDEWLEFQDNCIMVGQESPQISLHPFYVAMYIYNQSNTRKEYVLYANKAKKYLGDAQQASSIIKSHDSNEKNSEYQSHIFANLYYETMVTLQNFSIPQQERETCTQTILDRWIKLDAKYSDNKTTLSKIMSLYVSLKLNRMMDSAIKNDETTKKNYSHVFSHIDYLIETAEKMTRDLGNNNEIWTVSSPIIHVLAIKASIHFQKGFVYHSAKMYRQAIDCYQDALSIYKNICQYFKSPIPIAMCLYSISVEYYERAHTFKTFVKERNEYTEACADIVTSCWPEDLDKAMIYFGWGRSALQDKNYAKAFTMFDSSYTLQRQIFNEWFVEKKEENGIDASTAIHLPFKPCSFLNGLFDARCETAINAWDEFKSLAKATGSPVRTENILSNLVMVEKTLFLVEIRDSKIENTKPKLDILPSKRFTDLSGRYEYDFMTIKSFIYESAEKIEKAEFYSHPIMPYLLTALQEMYEELIKQGHPNSLLFATHKMLFYSFILKS